MPNIILLNPKDNVAVAPTGAAAGDSLEGVAGVDLVAANDIPRCHKVALRVIEPSEPILRYGHFIGAASRRIEPGEHVHSHNLALEEK